MSIPGFPAGAPEVVTIGECLVAMVAVDSGPLWDAATFRRYVAGSEMNVCVGLARLGHRPALITRVGGDPFGVAVVRALRAEGIDLDHVRVDDDAWTGVLFRESRGVGVSEVTYRRAGSAASRLGPLDVVRARGVVEEAKWLHVTGITPALSESCRAAVATAIQIAKDNGVSISFDVNLRRKLWSEDEARATLLDFVAEADLVFAGLEEATFVTMKTEPDAAAAALLDAGAGRVVLKLGAEGAAVFDGTTMWRRPAQRVERPVDVVGAGDAFVAGYLAASLEDLSIEDALDLGNACGAFTVASEGDLTGLPSRADAERVLLHAGDDTLR